MFRHLPKLLSVFVVAVCLFAYLQTPQSAAASHDRALPARPQPAQTRNGVEFVLLPGGSFEMGCSSGDAHCQRDELPAKKVSVGSFWLGRTELSQRTYKDCVSAGACEPLPQTWPCTNWITSEQQPATCMTFEQAQDVCRWLGARLPTAEEWEYAAKSGEGHLYPWGDEPPTQEHARFGSLQEGPNIIQSSPRGASPFGLFDMAGNVKEWTSSRYDDTFIETRGGSWNGSPYALRASNRAGQRPNTYGVGLGVRCAISL